MINKKNFLLILSLCTTHYATAAHSFSSEFPSLRTVCIGGIAVAATGALAYNYFFKPLSELEQANKKALKDLSEKIISLKGTKLTIKLKYNDKTMTAICTILSNNCEPITVTVTNINAKLSFLEAITVMQKADTEETMRNGVAMIMPTLKSDSVITVTFTE